ncbi:MAG: hypothetical protein WKF63_05305 [Thermomicrobiales bacterium]
MTALTTAYSAGIGAWKHGPVPLEIDILQERYLHKWQWYTGELFESILRHNPYRDDPSIYQNTKLLWKHSEAVIDFYAGVTYQGVLSTDGKPMPDGTLGAIPIDPQVPEPTVAQAVEGEDERSETPNGDRLRRAIGELWAAWNWQQQMSLRPMYGAALGDCLTELVDDTDRRFVYPQVVWPGYVKDIELDYVGNVQAYTLEYRVEEKQPNGQLKSHLFRKEVTKEDFRYFRDDQPYDEYGEGAIVANVYGFVPAVWDRHRIAAPGHVRGKAATDGTRQSLLQLNSIFSHAFDYQRKAFWLPPMVAGAKGVSRNIDVTGPPAGFDLAETFNYVGVPEGARLLQPTIDIGQTREMLADLREGILAENPEASFYQQMRQMQQVTAPGAERLMGDVKNRVDLARAGYDAGSVKLFQMALSMCGFRANGPAWKVDNNGRSRALNRRQMAFLPYDLESFDRGELDMAILPRPIVIPTETERLEIIAIKEALSSQWGMEEAGIEPDVAAAILAARREMDTLIGDFTPVDDVA